MGNNQKQEAFLCEVQRFVAESGEIQIWWPFFGPAWIRLQQPIHQEGWNTWIKRFPRSLFFLCRQAMTYMIIILLHLDSFIYLILNHVSVSMVPFEVGDWFYWSLQLYHLEIENQIPYQCTKCPYPIDGLTEIFSVTIAIARFTARNAI